LETQNTNKNGAVANGHRFEFGDLAVDPTERTCARNGQVLPMTGKVFDVLLAFVENPGRLMPKSELMEKVWPDEFVEEGNLARSVSSLRKALGGGPKDHKYIVTVQGRGYRFIANVIRIGCEVPTARAIGIRGFETDQINNGHPPFSRGYQDRNRNYVFLGVPTLLFLVLLSGYWVYPTLRARIRAISPIESIAVLPFENSTGDADLDYLSDGVTENVINALSPLPNLRVLPRNMVFTYKGKAQDPYSSGTTLGVQAVLTGIIVKRNDTLTIQTELIDVEKKAQIWGQQYVYQSSDISKIQNNIAQQVVNNLRVKPSASLQQELTRRSTANPDAQRAYMWGLYYFNQSLNDPTQKAVEFHDKSIENLKQATTLDSNYVQAYADLARSYQSIPTIGADGPKAKDAAQIALKLDETNPTAHSVLGTILWQNDWDWVGAEREFKRAMELSPNEAHKDYADLLSAECRHEEAIREIKIAEELDPLNQQIKARMGFIYKDARQYDLAIDQFNSILQMNPNLIDTRFGLIEAYALKGKYEEAETESQNLLKLSDRQDTRLFVGSIYAYMGRSDEAIEIYDQYKNQGHHTNILMASICTSLGDKDAAFFWLEKAFLAHGRFLLGVKSSPMFDPLHGDPRFTDLLKRMGLPS
jgi:TolB-like protein/DNA-binding winged helix-turn-helix (wHTH) protein/Flp pilus assembly protein TadD